MGFGFKLGYPLRCVQVCGKEPYLVERIVAEKSWWCKNCFRSAKIFSISLSLSLSLSLCLSRFLHLSIYLSIFLSIYSPLFYFFEIIWNIKAFLGRKPQMHHKVLIKKTCLNWPREPWFCCWFISILSRCTECKKILTLDTYASHQGKPFASRIACTSDLNSVRSCFITDPSQTFPSATLLLWFRPTSLQRNICLSLFIHVWCTAINLFRRDKL